MALPVPPHFDSARVREVWRVPYGARADEARAWADDHALSPGADDGFRVCLVLVGVQNTFCVPGSELYVTGRSGNGAVDDNRRLCDLISRNISAITQVVPTIDTQRVMQILHPIWLVE